MVAVAEGRALRKQLARSAHAHLRAGDRDVVALLARGDAGRVPALVPQRYGRMVPSPFAFFRGAAAVMAHDLGHGLRSAITLQLCGDAHLLNFGPVVGADGARLFGINDFDETLPGPFEWDIKRLAASIIVAGRDAGLPDRAARAAVRSALASYRGALLAASVAAHPEAAHRLNVDLRDATHKVAGQWRLKDDPPRLMHFAAAEPRAQRRFEADLAGLLRRYGETLAAGPRARLSASRLQDAVVRRGGIGSLGMRSAVVLLVNEGGQQRLLQFKQARPSCLAGHVGGPSSSHDGARIVRGQRLLQAAADPWLGWAHSVEYRAEFVVHPWRDLKSSADPAKMNERQLAEHALACCRALAAAQGRSSASGLVAGYVGKSGAFGKAIEAWACAYADRNEADWRALKRAVARGRVQATRVA